MVIGWNGEVLKFAQPFDGMLLPARASKQGNVIGSVRIYIYIYIYVCTKKNCN